MGRIRLDRSNRIKWDERINCTTTSCTLPCKTNWLKVQNKSTLIMHPYIQCNLLNLRSWGVQLSCHLHTLVMCVHFQQMITAHFFHHAPKFLPDLLRVWKFWADKQWCSATFGEFYFIFCNIIFWRGLYGQCNMVPGIPYRRLFLSGFPHHDAIHSYKNAEPFASSWKCSTFFCIPLYESCCAERSKRPSRFRIFSGKHFASFSPAFSHPPMGQNNVN